MIGAGLGVIEKVGDQESVGGIEGQGQDQAGGNREAVMGVGAGLFDAETAFQGAAPVFTHHKRQADQGDQAAADNGRCAAQSDGGAQNAEAETAGGLDHVKY